MPFPKTPDGLREAGYSFNRNARCSACNREIQWWWTPAKKLMPLDHGTLETHWATCPDAAKFRKKKEPQ